MERRSRGADAQEAPQFLLTPPQVSLPKGGGSVRGIGEKFSANPVTGTGAMSVPIATSPGRGGFGVQLALSYDSGAGNGPFGLGWSLGLPSITRKTDKGLPRYLDHEESDVFLMAGAEDLVPIPGSDGSPLTETLTVHGAQYDVRSYRPRIEGLFARIERWVQRGQPSNMFWRTISRDNVTTWFGRNSDSRIADPDDATRVFQWLVCETYDDRGSAATYHYVREDAANVVTTSVEEANRTVAQRTANCCIDRIRYGNVKPFLPTLEATGTSWPGPDDVREQEWMFEVRFDYSGPGSAVALTTAPTNTADWHVRADPFSSHRAGFEVRTYRLCRRVLMFHHFAEELGSADYLVRSTDFEYDEPADLLDPASGGFTVLTAVTQRSWQKRNPADGTYESRQLPPVTFRYSQPVVDPTVHTIDAGQLDNLPVGTQGPGYRWLDLNGEGLSGVLTEDRGAWYYKPNLGDGRFGPTRVVAQAPSMAVAGGSGHQFLDLAGDGCIDVVELSGGTPGFHERTTSDGWTRHVPFASLPNIDWQDPNLRFVDLTGDGHADALITEGDAFTWYASLEERGFDAPRRQRLPGDEDTGPRVVFGDGTQTILLADMSGDGLSDLVRIRNGDVCYWPNLGYGRFGRRITLANAPQFDAPDRFDPDRLRLTDIDGSGTVDVIYLGAEGASLYFNRSGNRLSHAHAVPLPVATHNLAAVQVADLLGNGTACLVWNSHLPASAGQPVRYIDLMAGRRETADAIASHRQHEKPHLLIEVNNNLGATTTIQYTPSTRFYVQDQLAGTPWLTRLPFPVHCVSRVTVRDAWRHTTFSSTYSYHHGYFDGHEREFRGFGRVEQVDTQAFRDAAVANATSPFFTQDDALYQAPVKTTTWYHTGMAHDRDRILGLFEQEYAPARHAAAFTRANFAEPTLPQPIVDAGAGPALSADEWREAMRAAKGMPLRQEVCELDARMLEETGRHTPVRLFSAAQHSCHLRRVQPQGSNRHAVFLALPGESFTCHYELDLTAATATIDPRIAHTLNLTFDDWGNTLQSVAVVYPRLSLFADSRLSREQVDLIHAVQGERHLSYTEARFTEGLGASLRRRHHRLPLPCEVRTYELSGDDRATGFVPQAGRYFTTADFRAFALSDRLRGQGSSPVTALAYHQKPTNRAAHKRLVEHARTRFWDDASDVAPPSQLLAFGQHGPRGLKYEDYKLALTDDLLSAVFGSGTTGSPPADKLAWEAVPASTGEAAKTCRQLLRSPLTSGYVRGTAIDRPGDEYWMRSGTAGFQGDAHEHFFLPENYTDAFGNRTTLQYGARDLFVASSQDALGNRVAVERFDYRVLAPQRLVDANGNTSDVAFDIIGLPVVSAMLGKVTRGPGGAEQTETGDTLAGFSFGDLNPLPNEVAEFFTRVVFDLAQASAWLGSATSRFVYHHGEQRDGAGVVTRLGATPAGACSILRERHVADVSARGGSASPLQLAIEYSDGAGQAFVKKVYAEPDDDLPPAQQVPRWITNGRTIVNNKGKPVLQFEPYFSPAAHRFVEPEAIGVSPVMFYDAPGRLVRREMPDGTFSRVEFSPWVSRSFDASDTVRESRWYRERLTAAERGAPAAGADAEEERAAGLASSDDKRAARMAALHAATPSETHFDSLGREVVAISHSRTPVEITSNTSLLERTWTDEFHLTFTRLDAEGKPLWIRDARGNLVMQYITPAKATRWADEPDERLPRASVPAYDVAGNLLYQYSMDAGDRWMIMDAAGKPMLAWDFNDRGAGTAVEARLYRTAYDALHRPISQWLTINSAAPALVEAFDYCDASSPRDASGALSLADAQRRNLVGQAVRHFDPSGLATVERVNLHGKPSHVTRRLVLPSAGSVTGVVDWRVTDPATLLESETFHHITEVDALGRMTRLCNWHREIAVATGQPTRGVADRVAVYVPSYNARGALVQETLYTHAARSMSADGALMVTPSTDPKHRTTAIARISYNAKGQKERLHLGNGTRTRYRYDARTFRLTGLFTSRPAGAFPDDCGSNSADRTRPARPCGVQNLHYVYDPVGNITHIQDDAQQTVYFRNSAVEPSSDYTYDALYRLIEATGREHALPGEPARFEGAWRTDAVPTNDALRTYRQRYRYDAVGNFVEMSHLASGGDWTRQYTTRDDSNRLDQTVMGSTPEGVVTYRHDLHGSMLNLDSTAPGVDLRWDWRDMIMALDLEGGGSARYQYGIDKQRTRKHIMRRDGTIEDRVYLGGYELYRRRAGASGPVVEEIESLHLLEGEQRVLLVDDVITSGSGRPDRLRVRAQTLFRYQYGNHLGSVGLELDDAARVISHEEFHPYGTSAYRVLNSGVEAPAKRYRYTGMERDEESGLSYHAARYIAPQLAVWQSCDPSGLSDGLNLYLYAAPNPILYSDTNGHQSSKSAAQYRKEAHFFYSQGWMSEYREYAALAHAAGVREGLDEARALREQGGKQGTLFLGAAMLAPLVIAGAIVGGMEAAAIVAPAMRLHAFAMALRVVQPITSSAPVATSFASGGIQVMAGGAPALMTVAAEATGTAAVASGTTAAAVTSVGAVTTTVAIGTAVTMVPNSDPLGLNRESASPSPNASSGDQEAAVPASTAQAPATRKPLVAIDPIAALDAAALQAVVVGHQMSHGRGTITAQVVRDSNGRPFVLGVVTARDNGTGGVAVSGSEMAMDLEIMVEELGFDAEFYSGAQQRDLHAERVHFDVQTALGYIPVMPAYTNRQACSPGCAEAQRAIDARIVEFQ